MRYLLIALLFFATNALAQPYIFAGATWSKTSGMTENISDLFLMPGVGYRFSRHVAIEAAYFNPGEIGSSFTQSPAGPGQTAVTTRTFDLSGGKFSLVGSAPIAQSVAVLGSVSAYRLKGKLREVDTLVTSAPPSESVTAERSASGTGNTLGAGVGVSFTATPSVELRTMLEWIRGKENIFGDGNDLKSTRTAALSIVYRF